MNVGNWLALGGAAIVALAAVAALRRRITATASGRRFFRHPTAVPGLFVLAFFVTIAIAAPVVAPYPPYFQIDITNPDLNLTSPDKSQLRRLTTAANPWTPGTWDATPQAMTGVATTPARTDRIFT